MNQEKIGKFIKNLRKKYNLTQKDLADKYNVTYQAVSKWENGKNMPDISLLKQMSEDFNISLDELFEGKLKKNKLNKKYILVILLILTILISIIILLVNTNNKDFNFKTLSTTCKDFTISGSIAYNDKKSAIYITNINYCGDEDNSLYTNIYCSLYESLGDVEKLVSSYEYNDETPITLDKFLQTVTFTIGDYKKNCNKKNNLYLLIDAYSSEGDIITYKVPLDEQNICEN